jgi:formamidopyrimidine-DNA glycosylase
MDAARWRCWRIGFAFVPELPEVETVRRNVEAALVGQTLTSVSCTLPKLLRDSPIPDLNVLVGHRLVTARRRAKVLNLGFDNDLSLLVHLKLAGQFAILRPDGSRLVAGHPVPSPSGPYPHKTTHVSFTFDDGTIAYLSDVRQFGWVRVMPSAEVPAMLERFGFGPEATGLLDQVALGRVFARRGIPVKPLLLDQTFIAGLGNIYVDEVLFRARVHPGRAANKLTAGQRRAILEAVGPVISEGIRQGGATIIHQRAFPDNNFPSVHGREGEACFVCGTTVLKTRVGGRGTYFCPTCQRPPRPTRTKVAAGDTATVSSEQ